MDALLGYSVIEIKSDLTREIHDVERKLPDYLSEQERQTGHRHIGIATDGAEFRTYRLVGGSLEHVDTHRPTLSDPRATLIWLDSALCLRPDVPPEPHLVKAELGRTSMAWHVAETMLSEIWERVSAEPEVHLKRSLWADHLARVYGSSVDAKELFFQHTYLSIVAKTIAVHVLGLRVPSPQDLLDGKPFTEAGIIGAVESDFFDWPLKDSEGANLVRSIAAQTGRFRLENVESDVLKGLYESLIDPEQRHELGEYYTPDWLAEKVCRRAIDDPLNQRVLDPSCGSGTFLFHAVRLFFEASEKAGWSTKKAVGECAQKVFGIDIHPLAVQIARVTYLLAIGPKRLADRDRLSIPVYLGDSLQWNTRGFFGRQEVVISVPGESVELKFPLEAASQPDLFDKIMDKMVQLGERNSPRADFVAWIEKEAAFNSEEASELADTYETLARLHAEGKDHVWAFVARNLARPVWLSQEAMRPDRIVGNPPWLSYRYMSPQMQVRFKQECEDHGIWVGGKVATHQDLSAYFLVRCAEMYFKKTTELAFVMPYAVMNRRAYEKFRTGWFRNKNDHSGESRLNAVNFTEGWAFPDLQPLFPVPSCVLFCKHLATVDKPQALPHTVSIANGNLPIRDAALSVAESKLKWSEVAWPTGDQDSGGSDYRADFHQGATILPRMLAVVTKAARSPLGGDPEAPLVESRRNNLEKKPWKDLASLRGNVEKQFLYPLFLGESIAPYRALDPELAVIPWSGERLMTSKSASAAGYPHLAEWMHKAETLWDNHKSEATNLDYLGRLDYFGELTSQFPIRELRVVYAKAGTQPAACLIRSSNAVLDHMLYWLPVTNENEGYFLCSILNSETVRHQVEDRQSRGQWGARHFDKVMFSLPIPRFDPKVKLHKQLATLGKEAEALASTVTLPDGIHFTRARKLIRDAIVSSGLSGRIDETVSQLLKLSK